jgi:hypothetical protein
MIFFDLLRCRITDAADPHDSDDVAIRTYLVVNLETVLAMFEQARESAAISLDLTTADRNDSPESCALREHDTPTCEDCRPNDGFFPVLAQENWHREDSLRRS